MPAVGVKLPLWHKYCAERAAACQTLGKLAQYLCHIPKALRVCADDQSTLAPATAQAEASEVSVAGVHALVRVANNECKCDTSE